MALFTDADDLYAHLGKLFQDAVVDPELAPAFMASNATIQYRLRGPEAQLTIRTVAGEEPQVDFGASKLAPDVVVQMDADVAHRFWLGKVNPAIALARGDIRTRGSVAKVLALIPLVKPVFPRYCAQLEAAGRQDLADVV